MRVVWIGGGTSAGKTSIARALADQYGLTSYHVDEHEREHARRRNSLRHPAMEAWNRRSLDETWVDLPVEELVEATLVYSRERIELIAEDLADVSARRPVVALARRLRVLDVDGTQTLHRVQTIVEEHFEPYLR